MIKQKTLKELEAENQELAWQLSEANDTIEAIRTGQVDAFVVQNENGPELYTLKSADQIYRVFIEKMAEGAVTLNDDGIILYCNSGFASLINLPLSEVIGTSFEQFIITNDLALFSKLAEKGWATESKGELCLKINKDGELPVLLSFTTLQMEKETALSIIVTDLSLQKDNERQLRITNEQLQKAGNELKVLNNELEQRVKDRTKELFQSREYFRFLADNLPVMVWTTSPDGNVDYFNNKWYQYTGMSKEDSLLWGWQKILYPDDVDKTLAVWTHCLNTGKEYNNEYRFLRASDGLYRWHLGTGLPFRNEEGQITEWLGICIDIEDQKAAMNRKDEFISMVSHELKTPITILKAFTQILYSTFEKDTNPKAYEFVGNMEKQINRLNSLVADLLDATKANEGELQYDTKKFDFNTMVNEVTGQIQLTTTTHTIEISLSETRIVSGDKNRLSQVLNNLITNAIKYSPNARKIHISSGIADKSLKLCVQDFGIGIPQKEQSKIFNRFFRANDVKSNTFPGLGLGLYISNEIMKRHSGSISFTSEEGKGSVFCMHLPVTK